MEQEVKYCTVDTGESRIYCFVAGLGPVSRDTSLIHALYDCISIIALR